MHLLKYTGFLAASVSLALLTHGCVSARGRVDVETCVIPPPVAGAMGGLASDSAECTLSDGSQVARDFVLMKGYVCVPGEDFFKILESRRR
jgi:hypothetical protein